MPELGEDKPTLGVDRIGDLAPACDLLGAVDARCPGIALAQRGYLGAFADDKAGTGALGVVFGHQAIGHITGLAGAGAGHGGHVNAVGYLIVAQA